MEKFYPLKQHHGYKGIALVCVIMLMILMPFGLQGQELLLNPPDTVCINGFSSEIIQTSLDGNCLTETMEVTASGQQKYALSHLTVAIPCGTIGNVANSRGWVVEKNMTDPTTGLSGFKIDNISNFGESHSEESFTVTFTVCSTDLSCITDLRSLIRVAYKAGQCVFNDDVDGGDGGGNDDGDSDGTGTMPEIHLIPKDVTCFNGNDGMVTPEVTGGLEPYTYQWSNGSTTPVIQNLPAGSFTLTVTDANGKTVEKTAVIQQPASAITIEAVVVNASCTGTDGSIDMTASGGRPPFSYTWSNGAVTEDLTAVAGGNYTVIVTDDNGCSASKTVTVGFNSTLFTALAPNYLECYQEGQGEITSTVTGGTGPYEYLWSNGDTTSGIKWCKFGSLPVDGYGR